MENAETGLETGRETEEGVDFKRRFSDIRQRFESATQARTREDEKNALNRPKKKAFVFNRGDDEEAGDSHGNGFQEGLGESGRRRADSDVTYNGHYYDSPEMTSSLTKRSKSLCGDLDDDIDINQLPSQVLSNDVFEPLQNSARFDGDSNDVVLTSNDVAMETKLKDSGASLKNECSPPSEIDSELPQLRNDNSSTRNVTPQSHDNGGTGISSATVPRVEDEHETLTDIQSNGAEPVHEIGQNEEKPSEESNDHSNDHVSNSPSSDDDGELTPRCRLRSVREIAEQYGCEPGQYRRAFLRGQTAPLHNETFPKRHSWEVVRLPYETMLNLTAVSAARDQKLGDETRDDNGNETASHSSEQGSNVSKQCSDLTGIAESTDSMTTGGTTSGTDDCSAVSDLPEAEIVLPDLEVKVETPQVETVTSDVTEETTCDVSPTDDHLVPLRPSTGSLLLSEREEGDGHEQPDLGYHTDTHTLEITEDGVHILEDGNFFYEVAGLSAEPEDCDSPVPSYQTKVKFSIHPIQVFSTHSMSEYDRRNDEIDPVAASAEYELEKRVERMDVFPVDIVKGQDGLGLSIIGMGVGADAGVEKLGIFVKTLTEGGAAQRDARIQINDQILEVDGKSLVGVTQAYAASVLRNTNGLVRFQIGREQNPEKSEVARLIQQSLEQDKKRVDHHRRENDRQQEMERELQREEEEQRDRMLQEEELMLQEAEKQRFAEEAACTPPAHSTDDDMSPELPPANIEVFELEESSSESVTPDMEPQVLFIKLKEAQYKNAVAEAEVAKLKAKMIRLENADTQKRVLEKKCEDTTKRLRELEAKFHKAQDEIGQYQDLMEGSQGQYINLEKKMHHQYGALEKKYHKAKKLIKDYQVRERDLIREREAFLQQQTERDQHYNDMVRNLKDRIFDLERQLRETQTAAGLPITEMAPTLVTSPLPQRAPIPVMECLHNDSLSEVSSESEDVSPEHDESTNVFQAVPPTILLDNTPSKDKAALAKDGGLHGRRPPSKRRDTENDSEQTSEGEDVEPFVRHDSNDTLSDTSSVSQTSYEPSHPMFSGMSAEIPDSPARGNGDVQLISNKVTDKSLGLRRLRKVSKLREKPKKGSSPRTPLGLGRSNLSGFLNRLSPSTPEEGGGGITLISSKPLETGYSSQASEINVDTGMVMEYDDDNSKSSSYHFQDMSYTTDSAEPQSRSTSKSNQWQSCAVGEWSCDQVVQWLICLELDQYRDAFLSEQIDGAKLLTLDSTRYKSLGIVNSQDKTLLKKRVKDLRATAEREKKKGQDPQRSKKKMFSFGKS